MCRLEALCNKTWFPTRNNLNSAGEGPSKTCWITKHLTGHKTRVTANNNTKESSFPLKRQILKTAITVLTPREHCPYCEAHIAHLFKESRFYHGSLKVHYRVEEIPQLAQNISQIYPLTQIGWNTYHIF